jgi:hypothetical protein
LGIGCLAALAQGSATLDEFWLSSGLQPQPRRQGRFSARGFVFALGLVVRDSRPEKTLADRSAELPQVGGRAIGLHLSPHFRPPTHRPRPASRTAAKPTWLNRSFHTAGRLMAIGCRLSRRASGRAATVHAVRSPYNECPLCGGRRRPSWRPVRRPG